MSARKCGHPLGDTRWCPDCELEEARASGEFHVAEQHTPTAMLQRDPLRQCDTCRDHDDECVDVVDKVRCWLYEPGRGMCPFLRTTQQTTEGGKP